MLAESMCHKLELLSHLIHSGHLVGTVKSNEYYYLYEPLLYMFPAGAWCLGTIILGRIGIAFRGQFAKFAER